MNILFLGAPVESPRKSLSYKEKNKTIGFNTGNIAIGSSLLDQIDVGDFAAAPWPECFDFSPEEANERFDRIVIPAANFLFAGFDLGRYADFIEKTDLPCVMVGLGAQAPEPSEFDMNIPRGTLRLISVVSERSKAIGVRGAFTAEIMDRFGFHAVQLVGCPSLYRNRKAVETLAKKPIASGSRLNVVINGSRNVIPHSFDPEAMAAIEATLIDTAIRQGHPYVLQNENPEMDIIHSSGPYDPEHESQIRTISSEIGIESRPEDWLDHIERNYHIFYGIAEWSQFISKFDFSVGTRLHATILALTQGVPAMLIRHDTRTSEMADLIDIPSLSIKDIEAVDLHDLYRQADIDSFKTRHDALFPQYADFLTENGLEHRLQI